jgi:alkylation response protein AidB-like acyl-CoA dehydrogenase
VNLNTEPELLELVDGVHRLLAGRAPVEKTRERLDDPHGADADLWDTLTGQMGLAALGARDETVSGGSPFFAQGLVIEEMGRALLASPYFASVALARSVLEEGQDERSRDLAARIGSGELRSALALADAGSPAWDPHAPAATARPADGRYLLTGAKAYVVDGAAADLLVVSASLDGEPALFAVEPAPGSVEPVASLDLTRWLATVRLDQAVAHRLELTAPYSVALDRALDRAGILLAMEQVGVAQRCLDLSVEYAKIRAQFGRPIGSFQAIKHLCADMYTAVETARSVTYYAAKAVDERPDSVPVAARLAQAVAGETVLSAAAGCIQVHGGIGFTWEHSAHLFYRRAHASVVLLGRPEDHRQALRTRLFPAPGRGEEDRLRDH